jgi:hypothetical protein
VRQFRFVPPLKSKLKIDRMVAEREAVVKTLHSFKIFPSFKAAKNDCRIRLGSLAPIDAVSRFMPLVLIVNSLSFLSSILKSYVESSIAQVIYCKARTTPGPLYIRTLREMARAVFSALAEFSAHASIGFLPLGRSESLALRNLLSTRKASATVRLRQGRLLRHFETEFVNP